MKKPALQPIRGFRDLYPTDMVLQYYLFGTLKKVADLMGFEPYDGPLLEPIELYTNKTSEELIKKQSYILKDRNDQELLLRPEMTPSLARMIAARANELVFPLKLFNLGLRYRYEAPQKGRSREFMQADFDILGSDNILADAEIINVAIQILLSFGATEKDFKVCINSRKYMEEQLLEIGIREEEIKDMLSKIDRLDKEKADLPEAVMKLINYDTKPEDDEYFKKLFSILKNYGIDKYCQIDLKTVRGLDYYTGLVFEVKKTNAEGRSTIIGGGRYDNLVSDLNPKLKIPGVGFAVSDVILLEFIKEIDKVPTLPTKQTKVLVTIFRDETVEQSISVLSELRKNNIASEIYPDPDKKLDKQLKYADRNKIPYVVIIGPEEIKQKVVKLKKLESGEQQSLSTDELIKFLISN